MIFFLYGIGVHKWNNPYIVKAGLANKYYPLKEIKVGTNVYKQIPPLKALGERELFHYLISNYRLRINKCCQVEDMSQFYNGNL